MKWTKEEIEYLKENYPNNSNIGEMYKKLKRSRRAIQHKAARIDIHRSRFPSNKPSNRKPRKIIDKIYYEKNKKKIYERKMRRRRRLKEEIINMLGTKCKICGYSKCNDAFDFHHEKGNKEDHINTFLKSGSRQKILKEAKKCILLCANCHRELHYRGL